MGRKKLKYRNAGTSERRNPLRWDGYRAPVRETAPLRFQRYCGPAMSHISDAWIKDTNPRASLPLCSREQRYTSVRFY
jgi:hypothetical protein